MALSTSQLLSSYSDNFDVDPNGLQLARAGNGRKYRSTSAQSFTPRSLLVGLGIGLLISFSNMYFGLQTGWISAMAMPSSLIGFAVFKTLAKHLSFPFSPVENVLIQTVAGAVGTMPLGCGFVGVIPALEYLLRDGPDGIGGDGDGEGGPLRLSFAKLALWSLGVCLFGCVFAVPLRKEVIIREKLKFPSGTATALMIRVLHGEDEKEKQSEQDRRHDAEEADQEESGRLLQPDQAEDEDEAEAALEHDRRRDWKRRMRLLSMAFGVSAVYTLISYFIPQIRDLPVFGIALAGKWLWTLNPSPAYIGQGIIMGPSTSIHMLCGAILGWGILSPLAKKKAWAPGPVDDWEDGSKGWIVWISLAIMLADTLVNFGWLMFRLLISHGPSLVYKISSLSKRLLKGRPAGTISTTMKDEDDAPPSELISTRTVIILLPLTLVLNIICMQISFGSIITPILSTAATILALVLSIMGVRALGETDLNPVSGISKLTQLIFAAFTPASRNTRRTAIVTNLLAGAVSEAGALQAGDMLQDLKTGHLLGASPKAQFYGQVLGSLVGAVASTAVYKLYVAVYPIPGTMFQVPTAYVWLFTARLVTGAGLPPAAWPAAAMAAAIWAILTAVRIAGAANTSHSQDVARPARWRAFVPGGIAVAVGMYNVPSFTLARAIGGVVAWVWGSKLERLKGVLGTVRTDAVTTTPGDNDVRDDGRDDGHVARDRSDTAAVTDGPSNTDLSVGEGAARSENIADEASGNRGGSSDSGDSSSAVIVLASGLILGEGVVSIVNLVLASIKVPHL